MQARSRKVYTYVTRSRNGLTQAAVFTHRDEPEAGIQVVKGTIEPGEPPAEAALREAREESGLSGAVLVGQLATDEIVSDRRVQERHFFHLRAEDAPDDWEHTVFGAGDDARLVFCFRWISSPDEVALIAGHADYLHLVLAERR